MYGDEQAQPDNVRSSVRLFLSLSNAYISRTLERDSVTFRSLWTKMVDVASFGSSQMKSG